MCKNEDRLATVRQLLNEMIDYAEHSGNMNHDMFRKKYDRACILTDGNLDACKIFSAWPFLKKVLSLKSEEFHGLHLNKKPETLRKMLEGDFLERTLPRNEETEKLSELITWSLTRSNILIFPEGHRELNNAKSYRCHDRMDRFLEQCFTPGNFSSAWENDGELVKWIQREQLEGFFSGKVIQKENLISFDVLSLNEQMNQVLQILRQRR